MDRATTLAVGIPYEEMKKVMQRDNLVELVVEGFTRDFREYILQYIHSVPIYSYPNYLLNETVFLLPVIFRYGSVEEPNRRRARRKIRRRRKLPKPRISQ